MVYLEQPESTFHVVLLIPKDENQEIPLVTDPIPVRDSETFSEDLSLTIVHAGVF